MSAPRFDFGAVFDADYLHFYGPRIDAATSRDDAELVAGLLADTLGKRRGTRVLDVGCGHGRIALELAARGCAVTGIDTSAPFLRRAKAAAKQRKLPVRFLAQDMRALNYTAEFDAALSWFSSFGYFDDTTDRAVLAALARALRPGGVLLLDHVNRDWLLANFQAVRLFERGRQTMIDRNSFDPIDNRLTCHRTVWRGGARRDMHYAVRLFTCSELRGWLVDAGFAQVDFVDGERATFSRGSDRMIAVARR